MAAPAVAAAAGMNPATLAALILGGSQLGGSILSSFGPKKNTYATSMFGDLQWDKFGQNVPTYQKYNLDQNSMMAMLQQMFNQGSSNLSGTMQRAGSGAGMNAFAQGSSMGLNNPFSLQQRARTGVMSQFAPQFGEMEQNRLNQGMNMPFKVNEFNANNEQMTWKSLMDYFNLKASLLPQMKA